MAYIGRQLARGENKLFDDISSSFNGSTTTFTLAVSSVATATATPYQLFVSLGGVMQKPNTDFTTAGNQITFTTAPAAGLSCWIMMQGDTIDNAAVADASITPSKISGTNFAFSGDLRLKDADGSHYVGFASPTTVSTNKVWTLPAADGSASQYLQTNGSGVLSWATVSVGGATGIDFNDNVKARWGTGNDLEVFHNGSNSVINDAGTGDLLLQVGGTTQATISSTGVVIANNLTVSGTTTTINTATLDVEDKNVVIGKVSSPSDTTADGGGWTLKGATDKTFNWVNATDAWTSSEHINLVDNKKLLVGTDSDLGIYHDASHSYINNTGTGNLYIVNDNGGTINLQTNGTENAVKCIEDGAVELYHDNSKKLETTTGGINVTGAINVNGSALATGLGGMVVLTSGSSASWSIPSGVSTIKVICTGGGGGATGPTNPPGDESSGAAGGGGGTSIRYYDVSGGGTATYTIGAGGTGHTNTGSAGNGGDSTFAYGGTTITGGGGVGGTASGGVGGTGGTASGGTMNLPGCGGEGGIRVSIGQGVVNAQGGTSYWGAGVGRGRRQGSGASGDTGVDGAANTGAGGTAATHNDRTGGAGGTGVIVIEY